MTKERAVLTGSTPAASDLVSEFSWRFLGSHRDPDPEISVINFLRSFGIVCELGRGRCVSHDIIVRESSDNGVPTGLYEVKGLSRHGRGFDRRFKMGGHRSEIFYGLRDAMIKRAALTLRESIGSSLYKPEMTPIRSFIDDSFSRRHGRRFYRRLQKICDFMGRFSDLRELFTGLTDPLVPSLCYNDLNGIFLVADDHITLIKTGEIDSFMEYNRTSSEGVTLSYRGEFFKNF